MTEIAVSHKYFSVTASEQGWMFVTERSQLGEWGIPFPPSYGCSASTPAECSDLLCL